ncbi:hypothetical protein [Actinomadura sp. DC4]|uniref:hypothetical protein n=1 Tax=Actinomadura sp. DC4 TaxID=3055069 RepID=UPI0025B06722|nr:hypothetical protein [Actinomadura sp. DC4]MDN3356216.1 hypothetical protein [Actinomadura sp. DC4]
MINTVPPGEPIPPPDLDVAAALEDLERRMPGAMAANEPGATGCTPLDDGEQTVLRAGDVLIQNGTRHVWHNRGTVPCTIVGVAIGADRTPPT